MSRDWSWARVRALLTGKVTWVDAEDGSEEHEVLSWALRWRLFGVHSRNWRWVQRRGKRDCGCTINPLTGRRILISSTCRRHFPFFDECSPDDPLKE